jgi:hypothetical protein
MGFLSSFCCVDAVLPAARLRPAGPPPMGPQGRSGIFPAGIDIIITYLFFYFYWNSKGISIKFMDYQYLANCHSPFEMV